MDSLDTFDYKCTTSVAPQQLQTATAQIKHKDDENNTSVYCLKPHMVVWSDRTESGKIRMTCFMDKPNPEINEPYVGGISLEPILDGNLAKTNPHSTARTAVAVGGVVSVAISQDQIEEHRKDRNSEMVVGQWLGVDFDDPFAEFDLGSAGGKVYAPVPVATDVHPDEQTYTGDSAKFRYIGCIVDNSELTTEHYVRVRLI